MNKFLKLSTALLCFTATLSASKMLLEKMPSNNKMVLLLDMEKCLAIPVIKEGLDTANQDPKIQQFVKATGFGIEDCKSVAVTLDLDLASGQPNKDSALMLLELKKSINLDKIIAEGAKNNSEIEVQKQDFNGKNFYLLKNNSPAPQGMEGMDQVGMLKLADKLLAVGSPAAVKASLAQSSSSSMTSNTNLMKLMSSEPRLFSLAVDTSSQPKSQAGQQPNPMSSVKGLALSGDMKAGDIFVNINAECFQADQAAGLMFMYNMMVAPQLQSEQSPIKANELKASVDESTLKVQLHLTKERLEEIKKQLELMKQLQGKGSALDPSLPSENLIK